MTEYTCDSFRFFNLFPVYFGGKGTRAEVTAIVNNMLGRAADEDFVDEHAEELTPFSDIEKHWAYYHIVEATNDHDYTKPSSGENWTKLN